MSQKSLEELYPLQSVPGLRALFPPNVRKVSAVAEEEHSILNPLQTTAFNYPNNCIRM